MPQKRVDVQPHQRVRDGKPEMVSGHQRTVNVGEPHTDALVDGTGAASADPFASEQVEVPMFVDWPEQSDEIRFSLLELSETDGMHPDVAEQVRYMEEDFGDTVLSHGKTRPVVRDEAMKLRTKLEPLLDDERVVGEAQQRARALHTKVDAYLADRKARQLAPGDMVTIPKGSRVSTTHPRKRKFVARTQDVKVHSVSLFDGTVTWVGSGNYWNDAPFEALRYKN